MNVHGSSILNINIDSISKKIDIYIKANMSDKLIDYHEIRNELLKKYLILTLYKDEHVAKNYLSEIDEAFSIYDRNKETRNMLSIKEKLESNIDIFIKNIEKRQGNNKGRFNKKTLELIFINNTPSVYDFDYSGARFFIYIDNKKNRYEITSFNKKKRTFNNGKFLLDYLFDNISTINGEIRKSLYVYKKKEFTQLAEKIEKWNVNENFLRNQIVNSINLKEVVKVNESFSIKLVESYNYKQVFIIKNNKDNSEKIVNIYTDNIEKAVSVISENYSKIKNKSESLIYEKNNKWVFEKKTESGVAFVQSKDFITPQRKLLERIDIAASSYTNQLSDNVFGGFCYGLSLRYLIEVRNGGVENAENYLKWLKKYAELYKNKPSEKKLGGFKEKIRRRIYEYNLMQLADETRNIIIAHNYQQERIKGKKYHYNSLDNQIPYSNVLKGVGLSPINKERILLDEKLLFEKIDGLLTGSDSRYIFVEYKEHQTAITYKKYSDGKYKVTFFEPRFGVFEYDNIEDLKKIIKEKKNIYGLYDNGYGFDEFFEVNSDNYKPLFSNEKSLKNREIFRNKDIAENLKTTDFSLEFSKDAIGRVMHYDEKGILIVQIKHNNRLIEISVVENIVEDGLFLIKNNINKIIEHQNVSKIVLKKTNKNISITPIEFNTVWAEKKAVGYIEFNKNDYISIISTLNPNFRGEIKQDFDKIKSLINKLNSNIYFEKLKSSFELINSISVFVEKYKDFPINEKLIEIKSDVEDHLFYSELSSEKNKIISLAENNSIIATKLYQVTVDGINNGNTELSEFIYNKIIKHKFLTDNSTRPQGAENYDYTIVLDSNNYNLKEIINEIDINQLKNRIYYEGDNQLHLRIDYNELTLFKNNASIKKLLSIIDKEIDKHRGDGLKNNQDIFTEKFINNGYINRILQLEFNELNNFIFTTEDHVFSYGNEHIYFNNIIPESFIEQSVKENIKKTGVGFILFDRGESNIEFIINNPSIIINNTKKIVTDLVPQIYQTDLNNYLSGIKNNARVASLLKDNEELKKIVEICAKNNIAIIAAGENDINGIHNEFINKNLAIKNFHHAITENTIAGEGVLIIADKFKLYNYRDGIIYIEGLTKKLNTPIYNVIDNKIRRSENEVIYTRSPEINTYERNGGGDYLIGNEVEINKPLASNVKDNIRIKKYFNNIAYSNKLYNKIEKIYPSFRNDRDFLLGYKDNIVTVIPDYSTEMTVKEMLDFIILNKYSLTKKQLGAIVREIDSRTYQSGVKTKQNKNFTRLFSNIIKKGSIDKKATISLFPQQQLLLNLKDGVAGRCEALTMLMLVAKYLEHTGDTGRVESLINNLMLAQLVINHDVHDEYKFKRSSQELIASLNELSENHHRISTTVGLNDNNKRSLDYVINKLTNKKLNSDGCYLQLYTSNHVITAWANLDKNNNNFGFYDPNFGLVEFSSKKKFISYLNDFFKSKEINAGQLYSLEKNIKNNFLFDKVLDINVRSLSKIKINNKSLDNIVGSNIINYRGVNNNSHENIDFSYNVKYKESIINSKKLEGSLLTINTAEVNGYYSFADTKRVTSRKVVLLLTEGDNLNNYYLNFSQEYHRAGYDLLIVDGSTGVDAGEKAYDYLIKNHNVDTDSILLHGHNRSGERAIDLYQSLNNRGHFPEGVVLSSSNNNLVSVLNKINQLKHKTNIYIAYDHEITDENNLLINKNLKSFGHEVKEFSFSHREEYNSFSDTKYYQKDPIRKFSHYQSRDLLLVPIKKESIPIIGMPDNDQNIFSKIANSENVIVGVRPIDARSTVLIQSEEYSSKGLLIKGKNSDWGPMAGFIPVDQSFAKLSARSNVTKYNLAIQESLENGYAISIPLSLSLDRVRELQQNNILLLPELLTDIIRVKCNIDNNEHDFYLSKSNHGGETVYKVNYYDNGKLAAVNVLADPISKKPMIADYDLFTVMYSYNDLSEKTTVRKPILWEEWKSSVDYEKLSPAYQEYYNNEDLYNRYEGEQLGLISPHVKKVKDKINTSLQRGRGREMIHHGADDANPYSVIADNFPATFFIPEKILNKALNSGNNTLRDYFIVNKNNAVIIRNIKEFSDFQQLMINNGFISPLNERWNEGDGKGYFSKKRKNSHEFIANREILENKNTASNSNRYKSSLDEINNKYFNRGVGWFNNNVDNIIVTSKNSANSEIEILSSPYNHEKSVKNYLSGDGVYNKLSINLKKKINQHRKDLDWFKKGGYQIFDNITPDPLGYLNRADSTRLNHIFNIILDLPEIKGSIYKSIYVDNLSTYSQNIDTGAVVTANGVLRANKNAQKIKQNEKNVFISIQGEHNARTMTGISERFTDQVMITPGKHFRVVKQTNMNDKLYIVLEATDILIKNESIFDLYNASLKGYAIDSHRSTVNESFETKISDRRLIDTISKINNEYIDTTIESNFIDKIINKKLTPEYAEYRYAKELSLIFGPDKDYVGMLNEIINDPLSNKKYNQYINNDISRDEWLNSFENKNHLNISLKEKVDSVKILVDAINDNPKCIDMLSDLSKSTLTEFFSSDFDSLRGEVLRIVSSQESYENFIDNIDKVNFYLTIENNFQEDPLNNVFYQVDAMEKNKKNYKNIILNLKKKLLNFSNNKNKYNTSVLQLPYKKNSETSLSLTLLYSGLDKKITHKTLMENIFLLEVLYNKSSSVGLSKDESDYLSIFNSLLDDISKKKLFDNNINNLIYGDLQEIIVTLNDGNYIFDVNSTKVNLNVSTSDNKNFTYDVFISNIGNISITGVDKEKMTSDLFGFLNDLIYVKKDKLSASSDKNRFIGDICNVSVDGIISENLFSKLDSLKNNIIAEINKTNIVNIGGINIDKNLLNHLGGQVEGKSIKNINLADIPDWQSKINFDAGKLNDFFLLASGSDDDNKVISVLKHILKNKEKNIKNIISVDASRTDYITAKERLMKVIELKNSDVDVKYWNALRKGSLKIPRHMRIISKIGYGNIGFGIWQSINSTMSMINLLKSGELSQLERKEITTNLAIMWSEMTYNGVSELIEIAISKGMLRYRANAYEYAGRISTRVGVILNLISIGFDIYNAYTNFSQISSETDHKRRIDYIVNGSVAIASALVTIGVSIAILAGCTLAGPIGIAIGVAITLITTIYNAARVVEDAKKRISFTVGEEILSGISVVATGKLTPKKQNEITLLETKKSIKDSIDSASEKLYQSLLESNVNSKYFYTNEGFEYFGKHYYKVESVLSKDPTGLADNGITKFIAEHLNQLYKQKEAETIANRLSGMVATKTDFKYYEPKTPIPTNETLIFDLDFYVDELYKYNIELESNEYLKLTKNNINIDKENPNLGLLNVNNVKAIYDYLGDGEEVFYFNTNNGNDIISAPKNVSNTFDIFNGTKRLSGGNKNDTFNLFVTESPQHASRFYGREGVDTLRIADKSPLYSGYNINLRDNYVKFIGSENQSNSLGFKPSKFYYFDEKTGVTSPFIVNDTMPNVSLQTDIVIAYLDGFENIIGSANGHDVLIGNDDDNYIDGISGNDNILGGGGNDVLRLSEGFANGAEGNDTYIISRLNESYKGKETVSVIIDEDVKNRKDKIENKKNIPEQFIIKFEHNLKDIKSIKRVGTDIIFILDNGFITNKDKTQTSLPLTSVSLKDIFTNNTSYELSNGYTFITNDGFILNFNNKATKNGDPLFYFSYMEAYSNFIDKIEYIYINEEENKFNIRTPSLTVNHNILPELKYSGLSDGNSLELSIEGNSENNTYLVVGSGSRITLTSGVDIYQLKTFIAKEKEEYIEIIPNKTKLKDNVDNISTFILPDVNGYDLKFEDGIISHRYNSDKHLHLNMKIGYAGLNSILNSGININIIDNYGKMFSLPKGSTNRLLTPAVQDKIEITTNDDSVIIPENMMLNKTMMERLGFSLSSLNQQSFLSKIINNNVIPNVERLPIIDLLAGNDILINKNQGCSVIAGGKGNDTLIVEDGHHLLFANEGNDKLYGGRGNDVLVSDKGNDYLEGGEGNDIYLISKHRGEITIDDNQGNNTLFIMGLEKGEIMSSSRHGDDEILRSLDDTFKVKIKGKYSVDKSSYQITQKEGVLSNEVYASIIHEMAQFHQAQLSSMQGTVLPDAPDWTLLPIITKHLG